MLISVQVCEHVQVYKMPIITKSEKIKSEILKILFTEKEVRFEVILNNLRNKKICSSRATLAKYLTELHKKKEIEYRTNPASKRETFYRINPLKFDKTSLYAPVMGALSAKLVVQAWYEQFHKLSEKFSKSVETIKIEDVEKTKAELEAEHIGVVEKSIPAFERIIGNMILRSLVYQNEKTDTRIMESLSFFIQFLGLSPLTKENAIKSVYQKDGSFDLIKKLFSVPYDDVERLLTEMMVADIEYNKLMTKVYGTESPAAKSDDNFYEVLEEKSDLPFFFLYNYKLGRNIPITKEKKTKK